MHLKVSLQGETGKRMFLFVSISTASLAASFRQQRSSVIVLLQFVNFHKLQWNERESWFTTAAWIRQFDSAKLPEAKVSDPWRAAAFFYGSWNKQFALIQLHFQLKTCSLFAGNVVCLQYCATISEALWMAPTFLRWEIYFVWLLGISTTGLLSPS